MDSRPEARAKGNSLGGFRLTGIQPPEIAARRCAHVMRTTILFGLLLPTRGLAKKIAVRSTVALPPLYGKTAQNARSCLALSPDSATVEASSTTLPKEAEMNIEAQPDAIIRNAEAAAEDSGIGDENDRYGIDPLSCAIRDLDGGFVEIQGLLEYALKTLNAIREEFQTKNDPREKAQAFKRAITLSSGLTGLDSGMVARLIGKRDVLVELLD
jgi:hypothetical protein